MRWLVLVAALFGAGLANAQEDDRGYLAAFLEDSLSDAGRQVTITGFTGALSSRATIETLTIADATGIWLTASGLKLDWSRSSLLSGALEISELSAESIVISRKPDTGDSDLPAPEAGGFSLPQLPVSIDVGKIAAARIDLGAGVLGQQVIGVLDASMQLADGTGRASLDLVRSGDGPEGKIILEAGYDNATRQLDLSLVAGEGVGGIVAGLLDLPGAPATEFRLEGTGPLEDFKAQLLLATDGENRLSGEVSVTGDAADSYRLRADLSGNLAPLLVPEYVEFFGTDVGLTLDAQRTASGRVTLETFTVRARALEVSGSGTLAADGLPEEILLTGRLFAPDGEPVLLPFGEKPTRIAGAEFKVASRLADGEGWTAEARVTGVDRADLAAQDLVLKGSGRIGRTAAGTSLGGTVSFAAEGLSWPDPALSAALGPELEGQVKFHLLEGSGAISLSDIRLSGQEFAGNGALRVEGLRNALQTTGRITVRTANLSRFALLVGQPIGGRGEVQIGGTASGLSGFLDAVVTVTGDDLQTGIAPVDRFLLGRSVATLSVLRDEAGTTIRSLNLSAGTLTLDGDGKISSAGTNLRADVVIADLSPMGAQYGGSAALVATFNGTADLGDISLSGTAQGLRVAGADRLMAGESRLAAELRLEAGQLLLTKASLENPQLSISANGQLAGALRKLVIDARLADLGLLIPDLRGPLTASGQATQDSTGYLLAFSGRGPGQVDGRLAGRIAGDFASADLTLAGTGQAGLANLFISPRSVEGPVRYDLRLNGPLRLSSLSGRVTLSNGRVSDPGLGFALEGIEGLAQIQAGQAQLSATARMSTGGLLRIDGPVALAPPFQSRLSIALDRTRLFDPELYDAELSGSVTVTGPLAGGGAISGALSLSKAELRVPESGFDSAVDLAKITHRNEPAEVRATRVRAGLIGGPSGGAGSGRVAAPFTLDLTVSAPGRIFLRGRGIDAELGGQIRLLGTTAAIIPSGAFNLIRGRLDILGKRLVLSQADLVLEGSLVPVLQIAASTQSDGVVSTVRIDGPADDPVVSFTSVPDLPQEEVLARLLFGQGLQNISALQAAQLANAVAALAGQGGEGLITQLRRSFGLDDLDLATAEDGSTALTVGKYISENLYTEVEIGQGGKSRISLNLDLREGVTVKGRVGADGETGVGIFIERDY